MKQRIPRYPDGSFRPYNPLTRAEAAALIATFFAKKVTDSNVYFEDIQDHWAKEAVLTLVAERILSGYPDGKFRPDATITRAEIATMLNRATCRGNIANPETLFSDIDPTHWAYDEIISAANLIGDM